MGSSRVPAFIFEGHLQEQKYRKKVLSMIAWAICKLIRIEIPYNNFIIIIIFFGITLGLGGSN
jgi:hypothetical protein